MLGVESLEQVPIPVTLNGMLVLVSSMVVDSSGNDWFWTTKGQSGYCLDGQSAATLDPPASIVLIGPASTTAGDPLSLTVEVFDAAQNAIWDPGIVQLTSSDPKSSGLSVYIVDSQRNDTFYTYLETAGTRDYHRHHRLRHRAGVRPGRSRCFCQPCDQFAVCSDTRTGHSIDSRCFGSIRECGQQR